MIIQHLCAVMRSSLSIFGHLLFRGHLSSFKLKIALCKFLPGSLALLSRVSECQAARCLVGQSFRHKIAASRSSLGLPFIKRAIALPFLPVTVQVPILHHLTMLPKRQCLQLPAESRPISTLTVSSRCANGYDFLKFS